MAKVHSTITHKQHPLTWTKHLIRGSRRGGGRERRRKLICLIREVISTYRTSFSVAGDLFVSPFDCPALLYNYHHNEEYKIIQSTFMNGSQMNCY